MREMATGTDGDLMEAEVFKDIGGNVKLDEDVVSGEAGTPAMVLNVSVPTGGEVHLAGHLLRDQR